MKNIEDASARIDNVGSAGLSARSETLRADLAEAEQHLVAVVEEGEQAGARGDSDEKVEALLDQVIRAEARVKLIAGMIRQAEETREITRGMEVDREISARELGLKRAFGGTLSARIKAEDAAVVKIEAAVEAIKTVNDLYADENRFRAEALILAARFDRPPIDLPRRHRPSTNKEVRAALGKVRAVALSDARELPDQLTALPWDGIDPSVARLMARIAGSPTADLIASEGPGILTAETWETHRDAHRRQGLDREAASREAEAEKVDQWLRQLLATRPLPLEGIEREARKAGIKTRVRQDEFNHATLGAAADRLGVRALRESPSKIIWWALPGVEWDSDRFQPLTASVSMSAMRG